MYFLHYVLLSVDLILYLYILLRRAYENHLLEIANERSGVFTELDEEDRGELAVEEAQEVIEPEESSSQVITVNDRDVTEQKDILRLIPAEVEYGKLRNVWDVDYPEGLDEVKESEIEKLSEVISSEELLSDIAQQCSTEETTKLEKSLAGEKLCQTSSETVTVDALTEFPSHVSQTGNIVLRQGETKTVPEAAVTAIDNSECFVQNIIEPEASKAWYLNRLRLNDILNVSDFINEHEVVPSLKEVKTEQLNILFPQIEKETAEIEALENVVSDSVLQKHVMPKVPTNVEKLLVVDEEESQKSTKEATVIAEDRIELSTFVSVSGDPDIQKPSETKVLKVPPNSPEENVENEPELQGMRMLLPTVTVLLEEKLMLHETHKNILMEINSSRVLDDQSAVAFEGKTKENEEPGKAPGNLEQKVEKVTIEKIASTEVENSLTPSIKSM